MTQIVGQLSGGLWYKKHCLKITPKTNTSGVRYRYPGKDWVEIDGDDYTVEDNVKGQCSGSYYQIFTDDAQQYWYDGSPLPPNYRYISLRFGPVERVLNPSHPFTFEKTPAENLPYQEVWDAHYQKAIVKYIDLNGNKKQVVYNGKFVGFDGSQPNNVQLTRLKRVGSQYIVVEEDDCGSCKLTIFKNGQIVHEQEEKECPEVEIINDGNCVDDEATTIEIETTPLGSIWISVVAFNRDGSLYGDIPPECIDIYNNIPFIPIGASPISGDLATGSQILKFIGQYCSAPGCERPTVVRNGDNCGESCLDGTCAINCGDHICCVDANGIAVQEIPLENYAGGN